MARPSSSPDLTATIGSVALASPVLLAAGTAGTLDEMGEVLDFRDVGAVVTKSITAEPRLGNPTWRILESRVGMLNAIGLANPGVEAFCRDELPRIRAMKTRVFASIAGTSIEDYALVAGRFSAHADVLPAIELNVSCPNVHGGTEFGADPAALAELVKAVCAQATGQVVLVKLSPITVGTPSSIVDIARAAIEAGAGGLTIANTIPAMEIDVETCEPRLSNVTGGLSGPAVHPVALKLVHDVYRGVAREAGVPIIGVGGVQSWRDAAGFVLAGASAVQIGSGSFVSPGTARRVRQGLAKWVQRQGRAALADLVGGLKRPD